MVTGIVIVAVGTLLATTVTAYGLNWTQNPWTREPVISSFGVLDAYNPSETQYRTSISIDSMAYDLPHLAYNADLIIVGNVLDREQGKKIGHADPGVPLDLVTFPSINNLVQVRKVLKGDYPVNKTINVVTEGDLTGKIFVEGSADLQKGEEAVFFLKREPVYDNAWVVLGNEQGKFMIDNNGQVHGNLVNINATSIDALGLKINKTLTEPIPEGKNVAPNDKDLTAPPLD